MKIIEEAPLINITIHTYSMVMGARNASVTIFFSWQGALGTRLLMLPMYEERRNLGWYRRIEAYTDRKPGLTQGENLGRKL